MTTGATTAIVYPETDGMPLPDGEYQAPIYVRIHSTLRTYFKDIPGAHVNGDTFIYYIEGNPRRSVSPDCYVVFDLSEVALASLSIQGNNTYLLWEVGKAPDFVLEIGSKSTADADLGRKRELYAELGVLEYWRYDATGGDFYGEPLVGERLVDGEYQRLEMRADSEGSVWSHSDALGLDLWWMDGELRFWDSVAGEWLLSHEEDRVGRLAAETRADVERTGRLAEREGRLAAEERVEQLEAELRRMRDE